MESGEQNIQNRLQGFLRKIKTEELRNRVSSWQKYLLNASSRFRGNSLSSTDEEETAGSSQNISDNEQKLTGEDVCTPSESGTCILVGEKSAQMEEPLITGRGRRDVKLLSSPEEVLPRNKSPVQQWVDSLPSEEVIAKEDDVAPGEGADAEVEGLTLGAEAVGVTCPRPYPYVQITNACGGGGSDAGSHCSSMESLLEARRPDPEEILLELGFGGAEEPDTVSRIPARFLQPSTLKGVEIDEFLKHEQLLGHTYASGFSGYRGLTGPYNTMPSGIVGKIMERLREAEVGRSNSRHHLMSQHHKSPLKESVLSPDNRKWLERQGVSPEPEGRRIILGSNSFVLAKDGGIVEGSHKKEGQECGGKTDENDTTDSPSDQASSTGAEPGSSSQGKASLNGTSSDYDEDEKSPLSSRMGSFDNEQLEIEYKTIALLANQLKGSDMSVDIVSEEDFYKLTREERKRVERGLIENALYTYQRRLRDLDLRCHLKEILASQADRVSSILGRQDQEWTNIARQMTTLLRHQETLRQELRFTRNSYEKS